MAGPITHTAASVALGLPVLSGLWMDAAVPVNDRRYVEATHGLPGMAFAALLGRRWLLGWCVHVAIDAITHEPGRERGNAAMRKWGWLP